MNAKLRAERASAKVARAGGVASATGAAIVPAAVTKLADTVAVQALAKIGIDTTKISPQVVRLFRDKIAATIMQKGADWGIHGVFGSQENEDR